MSLSPKIARTLVAVLLFISLIVAVFFWSEARSEVVFLCGNFSAGVTEQSVLKQLGTANWLEVTQQHTDYGRRIVSDSAVSLRMYRCNIDIGTDGKVITASVSGWF